MHIHIRALSSIRRVENLRTAVSAPPVLKSPTAEIISAPGKKNLPDSADTAQHGTGALYFSRIIFSSRRL